MLTVTKNRLLRYGVLLGLLVLISGSLLFLFNQGDLYWLSSKDPGPDLVAQKTDPRFKLPKDLDQSLIFVHAGGFDFGKNKYTKTTVKEVNHKDDRDRLSEKVLLFKPKEGLFNNIGLNTSVENAIIRPKIKGTGQPLSITPYAWNKALKPYLNALTDYADKTQSDLVLVLIANYSDPTYTIPDYYDLKAFSLKDGGKDLSLWITIYNRPEEKLLNYETGAFLNDDFEKKAQDLETSYNQDLDAMKAEKEAKTQERTDLEEEKVDLIRSKDADKQIKPKSSNRITPRGSSNE